MTRSQFTVAATLLAAALGASPIPITAGQPKVQPQFQPWWAGIPLPPRPQPPQPPRPAFAYARPSVKLRGPDRDSATDPVGLARWWAAKLGSDMEQLKHDLLTLRLPPAVARAMHQQVDAAIAASDVMEKAIVENRRKDWQKDYLAAEAAAAEAEKAVLRQIGGDARVVLSMSLSRAAYAVQHLGVSLLVAEDPNPNQLYRAAQRLAAALAVQSQHLHESLHNSPALGPMADRDAVQFARAAAKFNADIGKAGQFAQIRQNVAVLGKEFDDLMGALGRLGELPPLVRYQVMRVEGLYNRLTDLPGLTPPPPPPNSPRPPRQSVLAVGSGTGEPKVVVYADDKGTVSHSFYPYSKNVYKTGVRWDPLESTCRHASLSIL